MKTKTAAILSAMIVIIFTGFAYIQSIPPAYFDPSSPVMYFYQDTCSHCNEEKPILNALSSEGFRVNPVKLPGNESVFEQYGVTGTPTFVAVSSGKMLEGFQDIGPLRQFLLENGAKIK